MITGAVKNKVDQIWLHLYSGGITNPLTVIEQLTYLMFIRSLDKKEQENEKMANIFGEPVSHPIFPNSEVGRAMRWDNFKDKNPEEMFNIISRFVFPAIKAMKHGQLPDLMRMENSFRSLAIMEKWMMKKQHFPSTWRMLFS